MMTKEELEFYRNAAIAAMQGYQESVKEVAILADIDHSAAAKAAFNMADAMLEEYRKRIKSNVQPINE